MAAFHERLALVSVLLALGGVMWSGYRASKASVGGRIVNFSWLMVAVLVVQALVGTVLAITGSRPVDTTHLFFGPLTLLALPAALVLRRGRSPKADAWILLAGWIATFALSLRDLGTGGVGA